MQTKNNISAKILLLILCIFNASCEKGLDLVEYPANIYLPQSGISEHTLLLGESTYSLGVYKSGINSAKSSTVVMGIDQEAFDKLVLSNPSYEMLPAEYYTLVSPEVRFSDGQERGFYDIRFRNVSESFVDKNYILPIRIVSVSDGASIDPEKSTAILHFKRYRNQYEGEFYALGSAYNAADPAENKKVDLRMEARSVNANTLVIPGPEANMSLYLTIVDSKLVVSAAPGSEHFMVQDNSSTINGEFDPVYQRFRGNLELKYKYMHNSKEMVANVKMTFTL